MSLEPFARTFPEAAMPAVSVEWDEFYRVLSTVLCDPMTDDPGPLDHAVRAWRRSHPGSRPPERVVPAGGGCLLVWPGRTEVLLTGG